MTDLRPTYDLALVRALVDQGRYRLTASCLRSLGELGFDEFDVVECLHRLAPKDFHKSMPSQRRPGLWQDVYRPRHAGVALYVKVQVTASSSLGDLLVVISFKEK